MLVLDFKLLLCLMSLDAAILQLRRSSKPSFALQVCDNGLRGTCWPRSPPQQRLLLLEVRPRFKNLRHPSACPNGHG